MFIKKFLKKTYWESLLVHAQPRFFLFFRPIFFPAKFGDFQASGIFI